MKGKIKSIFEKHGIEYFAVLDYTLLGEINPHLRERLPFSPKSAIVFLVPYYSGECENFSRYAASIDYHIVIKQLTDSIIGELSEAYPGASFRAFGDHSPINERQAATLASLVFIGDNGLIINEKYGSYVFVADILSDILPSLIPYDTNTLRSECLHCGRCRRACPTGVLRAESSLCLSAITQKKGDLTEEEISLMKKEGTVWGCDLCQSVCPYNKSPKITPIEAFKNERIDRLSTELVEGMSDEEFSRRAFAWRGRKTVLRNLKLLNM